MLKKRENVSVYLRFFTFISKPCLQDLFLYSMLIKKFQPFTSIAILMTEEFQRSEVKVVYLSQCMTASDISLFAPNWSLNCSFQPCNLVSVFVRQIHIGMCSQTTCPMGHLQMTSAFWTLWGADLDLQRKRYGNWNILARKSDGLI